MLTGETVVRKPCKTAMPHPIADGQTKWPTGPGGNRAAGRRSAQEKAAANLAASTPPSTVSLGGCRKRRGACAIGGPRLRFKILKQSPGPLIAAPMTTQTSDLSIDSILAEPAEQKGRRRYSTGGVGERLWSWGEEAGDRDADRDARASARSMKFRRPLEPTRRVGLRRAWREAGTPGSARKRQKQARTRRATRSAPARRSAAR